MVKSELDKFYTKTSTAQLCIDSLQEFTDIDLWLEPSAGAGAFLELLPQPRQGLDISPDNDSIIQQDYLTYKADKSKRVAVVGNPPFGKNSSLAIKFFNHSAKFAKLIAFIVPKTFRKVSIQNKLDLGWVLYKELDIPSNSFILYADDGSIVDYDVPCIWQIWIPGTRKKVILKTKHDDWEWTTKENASYAIRRVGALAGKCFESFDNYSESSHYFIKSSPEVFEKLNSLYKEFQVVAKNTAGNPSLAKGELVYLYEQSKVGN